MNTLSDDLCGIFRTGKRPDRRCGLACENSDEAEKEDSMKVTYVAPEVEITVVDDEDVIMVSGGGLEIKDSGDIPEISWGSLS